MIDGKLRTIRIPSLWAQVLMLSQSLTDPDWVARPEGIRLLDRMRAQSHQPGHYVRAGPQSLLMKG